MSGNFSENLRSLCAEHGSIAQICREIGINRQQFNRYLNGSSMPAAHNLRRIARYFAIPESQLFTENTDFETKLSDAAGAVQHGAGEKFMAPFRGQQRNLKRYLGFYHAYFRTPSWGEGIFCSLTRFSEEDGYIVSRNMEIAHDPEQSIRQISRYHGMVTLRGNRLFITEHERAREGSVAQTILFSAHRQQLKYLRGMTMGVAWRPFPRPYAARAIWKRLDERVTAREAIAACGVYPVRSPRIDPAIRKYLEAPEKEDVPDTPGSVLF
ncbi:DNA-binding protein [Leisingera sp. ANG-M1]|uniref:helix-turn-helix transcriptional regulator n=1 Tax=Leisingera sp. ANG-M1 TaxID=1577895 RepID=UPI00057E8879|nr:helix-turn-helix transcriptional regulator [Leisingera sp. ANG-M1]KIC09341.1 DNA-binding protein [Leisingera sp. ANG-M1]